jgi:prepilin-type N-terminal cleavage/methylation domain-containing protein
MYTENKMIKDKNKAGFTIIEVMVAILIIALLSSMWFFSNAFLINKSIDAKVKTFAQSVPVTLSGNFVAYWNFDNCTAGSNIAGSCLTDSWGANGYNGNTSYVSLSSPTPVGASGTSCVDNNCLVLNGSGNYVIPINQFAIGKNMTLSLWLKSSDYDNTNGSAPFSMSRGTLATTNYLGLYFHSNVISWCTSDSSCTNFGTATYPNSNWHHFLVVNNYNNGSGSIAKLYIDGVASGTATYIDTTAVDNTSKSIVLGYFLGQASPYYFNGSIDEVQIFDGALDISQVKEIYLAGLNNFIK